MEPSSITIDKVLLSITCHACRTLAVNMGLCTSMNTLEKNQFGVAGDERGGQYHEICMKPYIDRYMLYSICYSTYVRAQSRQSFQPLIT